MKKILCILSAVCFTLSFCACAKSKTDDVTAPTKAAGAGNSKGKAVVVYFSATGNTKNAADLIAQSIGADLFEIQPEKPYDSADLNWNDEDSRVSVEHDSPDKQKVVLVSTSVPNWENYDTVYIGYPIWWGVSAWPVDSFVAANDFSGKTVIPFCTSASSDIGQSDRLLSKKSNGGNWVDGKRFSSSVSEDEITKWLETVNR